MQNFLASSCITLFRTALAALALACALSACSGAKPDPTGETKIEDLMGFSSALDPEAQKLYAKARIMWDSAEKCSDPELAMEYLDVAITLEPEYADAYMRRALAASQIGEWDEAFNDSSRAIRLQQKGDYYALRSLIFMREGNYKGARKDLERAIQVEPKNARVKHYLKDLKELEAAEQ